MSKQDQTEMPIEGKGVSPVKDKKLDKLCDDFLDKIDTRATLSEEITATETKILDRMEELKVTVHRFRDQLARIKPGKAHVKIKTVKADANGQ